MTDIFISYARSTEREARAIGEALRGMGYGVWRDDELPAHRAYADVIAERLELAKAVVVVWSAEAAKSEWVRSEAEKARAGRKLVQLSLDGAALPMPFDQIQCADLAGWQGDSDHPGWRKVTDSVAELAGRAALRAAPKAPVAPRKQAICVLPFINMSGDLEQEYFSDGVSEDIITDLSKVSALFVVARNTAFAFKGKATPITQVARDLGVGHVLEGSVRKAGNRVRITAQLIDGESGGQVWAERWDRDLTDIFALQDEISQAVVAALKIKLLPEEKKAIAKRGTENVEAYDLYLMARRYYLGNSTKRFDLVIRLCQGAIDLDPNYASAWALIAVIKSAKAASGSAAGGDGWSEVERALNLDPGIAEAHAAKAKLLMNDGRYDEAGPYARTALAIDALSVDANRSAGNLAMLERQFADAIRYFNTAAATDEADASSPFMSMQCFEALGDLEGARAAAREAVRRVEKGFAAEPDNASLLALGAGALALIGELARARDWARHAVVLEPDNSTILYNLACAFSRLGDPDTALNYLANSLDLGPPENFYYARDDSDLDALRANPRFTAVMKKSEARLATAREAKTT
jgi:adenylate cyclase